jgi:four helix bundle protein
MSERVKHFTDLTVWEKSHQLFLDALKDIEKLPNSQAVRIVTDQLIRSLGSVSANIAEGFNARSLKQYLYYLDVGRNSSSEAENWYYKIRMRSGWMKKLQ